MVCVVIRVLLMQRMLRSVGVGRFSALMMVTMVMVAVFAVVMFVAVVALTVVNVLRGVLVYRCRCWSACWGSA